MKNIMSISLAAGAMQRTGQERQQSKAPPKNAQQQSNSKREQGLRSFKRVCDDR